MKEENYSQFWQWANKKSVDTINYLNVDILSYGVMLPYWNLELLTQTMFKPGAVLLVIDLFYNDKL